MPPLVFIMIDGARPDALTTAHCPHFSALRARSSWTLQASSVMPSITLPCHTSIFHSVPPARHGITSNVWTPMARPLPGIVELAHAAKLKTAFIYNWECLRDMNRPLHLDFSYFRANFHSPDGDQVLADEAARCIAGDQPDFTFIYFGTVDQWGHDHGWMSEKYLAQLERVDTALGAVLNALAEDYAVLLQADHGGHDRSHGTDSPEDMTIPWLVAGPGVKRGYEIKTPVSLLDTAPTIARLLGVAPHSEWEGRAVGEIFE